MENITVLSTEFMANYENNVRRLSELFKAFDLAQIGYDLQEERCKECSNEVLRNHKLYASVESESINIKVGDRIIDEFYSFLLSEEDFQLYLRLTLPILQREGIADSEGYYIVDWLGIKGDARRELIDFIIDKVLPKDLRETFKRHRMNIVQMNKLLDIVRPLVKV